jgi:protein-S-isoprenylcysteine O-methyltransferase Ste14
VALADYGYGYWGLVVISVVLFSLFISFLPYRREGRAAKASKGILVAFFVALFAEMYGFPLTIYILTWLVGYQNPLTHESGHLLFPELGMLSPLHFLSIAMIGGGILLVSKGWSKIYNAKDSLVTDGVYSYVRHPQYLGIFLVTSGFLLQWITIPTAIMFPILVLMYYRLAKKEEGEMERLFGDEYRRYRLSVPMFIPVGLLRRREEPVTHFFRANSPLVSVNIMALQLHQVHE